jgi:hypothetical protein
MAYTSKSTNVPKAIKSQARGLSLSLKDPSMFKLFIRMWVTATQEQSKVRVNRNHAIGDAMKGSNND